jgi:hypothetical protein
MTGASKGRMNIADHNLDEQHRKEKTLPLAHRVPEARAITPLF